MGQSPNPIDPQRVWRAQIYVGILSVLGIALFGGLWVVLGDAGMSAFPRLFISMCIPPALIALIVGGYFLMRAE